MNHLEQSLGDINRAQMAAITLESYYCGLQSHVRVSRTVRSQQITNDEAEAILDDLAHGILSGRVRSHAHIASVLRSLGDKLTESGGISVGINRAALKVDEAIIQNDSRFGPAVPNPKSYQYDQLPSRFGD